MKHNISGRVCLMAVLAVLTTGTAAFADITATQFRLPYWPTMKNAAAFDKVNQVYLVTLNGHPVSGQFLDKNGAPIGGIFPIASASEGAFISWSQIAFGGPSTDPAFLVTYIVQNGSSYVKYGRLVRYRSGAAAVGPPSGLIDTAGQWQAQEKAQSVWLNDHFVVATRVFNGVLPQPVVQRFEMNGSVSAAVSLGDSLDFEGSPTVACAPSGVCLATGFAGGIPFNTGGAVFARLFDGNTLALLSGLFYLDDHSSRMDDPSVVFNSATGQFLTAWWQASYAQFRTVATSGAPGPYGPAFGPWAGDIALRFNAATGTTLLVTKWANPATDPARWADLYAVEVDSAFRMSPVAVAPWDGAWPDYWSSIAADEVNGRWLVTSFELAGGRGALVTGGRGSAAARGARVDLNRDGKGDLVWQNQATGQLSAWMMDSVNVIGWGLLTPSAVPDTGWKIVGTPDFNKDGNFDLLWRHDNGWVSYWLMSADRVSSWSLIGHVSDTGWRIVATGDMNGDSWDDIIWQHQDGRVSYWYMAGPAWRDAQVVAALGDAGWRVVGATDIDRDGKTDLVWRHAVSGVTSVWFMNDRTALSAALVSFQITDTNWQIVAFNDVNMDGNTDFIWRNAQNGQLSVWFMNGKTMVSGVSLNPDQVADTHWRIVGPR